MLISGCGSSSHASSSLATLAPQQIVASARAAAASAATAHVSGSIEAKGRPISLDMELLAGKGGKGVVTLDGLSLKIIAIEHEAYLNGGAALYDRIAGPAAARLLQGRWVKVPENSGDFAPFYSLASLTGLVDAMLADHGPLKSGAAARVDGEPAVAVTDTARGGTLYVAATGQPYPLEISRPGPGGGRIVFDRWNEPVALTPPANWVNINNLNGAG
jgi:hypothetical protein